MKISITEALAEIKLIEAKKGKKQQFVVQHLVRPKDRIDPLAEQGGSEKVVSQYMQSLDDLNERLVAIRRAVSLANQSTTIEVFGVSRTIQDWLAWRRDVYPTQSKFLDNLARNIVGKREQLFSRQGLGAAQQVSGEDMITHIDEKDLIEQIEALEDTNNKLDGILSLKNAQIEVEVP